MEGASLRLVDNSPGVPENPGLSVKWGGTFVPALYLNDAINVVTYSSDNATVNSTWVPYPGAQTWTGTINSTGSPELEVVQSKDEFNVTRTETINDISASIGLSFRTTNTTLRAIDFDVWVGSDLVLGEAETWTDGISGVLSGGSSISIPFTIMVAHDASVAVELTPTNQEPLFRVPAIEIHASAGPNATTVRLGLTITFPGLPTDGQPIALYTASEIAAAYGIGYVFQSQCLDAMYRRFATDTADFTVVYQNERIAIYEVHFGNR